MKIASPLFYAFLILFIGFVFFWVFLYVHEKTHQEIFTQYRIDSEVKYENGFPSFTIPEKSCPNEGCEVSQRMVDVVGYQIMPIFAFFIVVSAIGLMLLKSISVATEA